MSDEEERLKADMAARLKKETDQFDAVAYGVVMKIVAHQTKVRFDAFVAAGFSQAHALQLART